MKCETCLYNKNCQFLAKRQKVEVMGCTAYKNADNFVEVVRCKNCAWWEACGLVGTIGKCQSPHNGLWNEYTDTDDYCSYGKRKVE